MAERIVERLIRERDTRYGDGIYTTTQIQFAWNSNHMEGSTLTAKQTAQLFATGTYTKDGREQVDPDDELETRNNFAAFRWILDHVPEFMDRLFDMCTKLEDEPYQIARVHWTFEKIHPFSDGNGRIGRLIMFKELLRIDALPALVHDAYRAEYVNGISKFPDEPGWLVDTLLFERDLYRSHVLKTDAEALRYTYHDQWNMAEHRVERDEDLEFAKLIDTKAQPLFDEEYQQRERLLWGE